MEKVFGLFLLFIISIVSWFFALNPSARRNHLKPGAEFFRMNKEQREMQDAALLAASLILAIVFSIIFVSLLIITVADLFK
jgi:energy-coupling factor transporter transmembrane protein EcfT